MVAPLDKRTGPVTLKPVRSSAAIRSAYQRKLEKLIEEMHRSVAYWLKRKYGMEVPRMAYDASPARELRAAMRKLARRWQGKIDDLGPKLAAYFAKAAGDRVDDELRRMLRDAGFTVRFKMTKAQNDALQATIGENVSLIKSLGERHLTAIEGVVMRSVQAGRDTAALVKELEEAYGVTRRRAAFIAKSQNNMATATLTRARQRELGVTKAIWRHSAGGKHPRPEHVAFSGKTYDIEKGAYLEGKWTWPGREPNCRCVSQPIIPGFDS
jgi:SPP1 gp7 family putative phage head morphogenesis protein